MKRIASLFFALVLTFVFSISVFAAHDIYDANGNIIGTCDNVYYNVSHSGKPTMTTSTHRHTTGAVCTITYYGYNHVKTCSSCGTIVGTYWKTCTEKHSVCGKYVVNCLQ